MATDARARLQRFALPAGLVVIAALVAALVRFVVLFVHELGRIRPVGAALVVDRMSQLKPWPWKGGLGELAIALFVVGLVACVAALFIAALRSATTRR
jgi:uncharacterized membrane protein